MESSPEVVQTWIAETDDAISWLEANATVCPTTIGDDLPEALREHVVLGQSDMLDPLIIAMRRHLLLVTDDMPIRNIGQEMGFRNSCWSQAILLAARSRGIISLDDYIRAAAILIDAGHNYIGVSSLDLARALQLDAVAGQVPGRLFGSLSESIGGKQADPQSHVQAVIGFLTMTWSNPHSMGYRAVGTSLLMRQLIRWRHDDYGPMLRAVISNVRFDSSLVSFLMAWIRGHFIPLDKI